LNVLEWRNGRYFVLIRPIRCALSLRQLSFLFIFVCFVMCRSRY